MKHSYIIRILFIALAAILCLQLLWLFNMHESYQHNLEEQVKESFQVSIDQDFHQRRMELGGNSSYVLKPEEYSQNEKRQAILALEDTTIIIEYNPGDLYERQKLDQFIIKHMVPFDVTNLKRILEENLTKNSISYVNTCVEFHDNEKDTIYI
ncbi:MAG: hypothetical protein LIO93_09065 [Bacteroidales bacterium]|nr:hypothetical protein [Bacteroidales bacterium]